MAPTRGSARKLTIVAAVIGLGGFGAVAAKAGPAQPAACAQRVVAGDWTATQSNMPTGTFTFLLTQYGSTVGGTFVFTDDGNTMRGNVSGSVIGNAFDAVIDWGGGLRGHYTATAPPGHMTNGYTFQVGHPENNATWSATGTSGGCAKPFTARSSLSNAGAQGNASSLQSVISSDGRFVAFASDASDLVPADTNKARDVFVRDRRTGVTSRVSVTGSGGQANGRSYTPSISGDGRYVAFSSEATNLVKGDTNHSTDIFIRDRVAGLTRRVSVSTLAVQGDGRSTMARVTPDGRFVVYESLATNLAAGETHPREILVRDRLAATTTLIPNDGAELGGSPTISASGRWVAYLACCDAIQFVAHHPNDSALTRHEVFLFDRATGVSKMIASIFTLEFYPIGTLGGMSDDGRYIAYILDGSPQIYDRVTGTTASVGRGATSLSISGDGQQVAFTSSARVKPQYTDVFEVDRASGVTELLSVHPNNALPDGSSGGPSVNADGSRIAFDSAATDLVPHDTNGEPDTFVRGTR